MSKLFLFLFFNCNSKNSSEIDLGPHELIYDSYRCEYDCIFCIRWDWSNCDPICSGEPTCLEYKREKRDVGACVKPDEIPEEECLEKCEYYGDECKAKVLKKLEGGCYEGDEN